MKPRMFIASSADNLNLAYAAQESLDYDVEVTVWNQGTFALSRPAMSSLLEELDESDFGLFVFAPSDVTQIKDTEKKTVRDNVIFELGLFIGRLGADRCFIISPRDVDDLHLPTDLTGITLATYNPDRQDENLVAALGPACNKIRKSITKQGKFEKAEDASPLDSVPVGVKPRVTDENDAKSLIQSWMGARASAENHRVIRYADVDDLLNLAPGLTEKHIEEVAKNWRYVAERKGADTILFKQLPRSRPQINRGDYF